jgi:hypothetical protein
VIENVRPGKSDGSRQDTETVIDDDEELEDGVDEYTDTARYNWGDC